MVSYVLGIRIIEAMYWLERLYIGRTKDCFSEWQYTFEVDNDKDKLITTWRKHL